MNKHSWIGVAALVLYSGLIFYLSSIPSRNFPFPSPIPDKLVHFLIYFGLGGIFNYLLNNLKIELNHAAMTALTLVFFTFYGLGDEFHQRYVVGRSFDLLDLMMDVQGGMSAHLIIQSLRARG